MPKRLPKHREKVSFRTKPNNMPDTDSIRIATFEAVGDAERATPALLTPATQEALIPPAWRQLIPDKRGYAA
jgi:hypothetical protein